METEIDIFPTPDDRFCLTVTDTDDATYTLFEERELQGGGYTWQGIVEALIQMHKPELLSQLLIDAEADNMYMYCKEQAPLEEVAAWIRAAVADHDLMLRAIDAAGDDLE